MMESFMYMRILLKVALASEREEKRTIAEKEKIAKVCVVRRGCTKFAFAADDSRQFIR